MYCITELILQGIKTVMKLFENTVHLLLKRRLFATRGGGGVGGDDGIYKEAIKMMKFESCTFASIFQQCLKEKQVSPSVTGLFLKITL